MARAPSDLDLALCATVAETCTAAQLRRASRAVSNAFDARLRAAGLRSSQFSALVALALAGEAPVSRLAGRLGLDRTTMTRNLGPLVRRGLVVAAAGDDRRSRVLRLTPKGRALLSRALPIWEGVQAEVVRSLGPGRWKGLLAGLRAAASFVEAS